MKKQVKLTAKSENTCKEVYEQSPDFHQCGRFCQMQCCSIRAPKRPYGQNAVFWDLPVKAVPDYGKRPLLAFFIAAGIVSQSTLSRFEESGNIDFLSLILLLKRLGMSPLEFIQYCTDFETGDSDYCLK